MKTREYVECAERLELLSALPLDFISPDAKINRLPDAMPEDMVLEIMQRAPAKMTLFAQTSCHWRSYYYLQQLKLVVLSGEAEQEERLLVDLLSNSRLLVKDSARDFLPRWVAYLKNRYLLEANELPVKFRLYAQVLLLILESDRGELRAETLDVLLALFQRKTNISFTKQHQLLCGSLRMLSRKSCGHDVEPDEINIEALMDAKRNQLESVDEARLILAPYAARIRSDAMAFLSSIIDGYVATRTPDACLTNYVYLLHAVIKMMPSDHVFWHQSDRTFPELIQRLPWVSLLRPEYDADLNDADLVFTRIDLILTLIKNPWSRGYQGALLENISEQESSSLKLKDFGRAITICALTDDQSRLDWLQKCFNTHDYSHALFGFVKRECAKLTTDVARKQVIVMLEEFVEANSRDLWFKHARQHVIEEVEMLVERLRAMISSPPTHESQASPSMRLKR